VTVYWLPTANSRALFPPVELADRDGLLAAGGDLAPSRLLQAYRQGIFPWYSEGQPILWWSPDPRMVLYPGEIHVSRSMRRHLRRSALTVRTDTAFRATVESCACTRPEGTWITPEMMSAYERLHDMGFAHSIECWDESGLAGGLYGVAIGRAFYGESMFTRRAEGSKVALIALSNLLVERGYRLMDCQVHTGHLERMGARLVPRQRFLEELREAVLDGPAPAPWSLEVAACRFA